MVEDSCVAAEYGQPLAKVVVGGVPEHFNSPFKIGKERGIFAKHGIDLEFVECFGGTGEMTKKLKDGSLDIAVALTEGLIASIARDPKPFRLVASYTASPLTWAIAISPDSKMTSVDDLEGAPIGISRLGSGSHIMTFVLARQHGWRTPNSFLVLDNFKGLRDGTRSDRVKAFLWEHFTTKPFFDSREVSRIGEITTPWPAFLIAARSEMDEAVVKRTLQAIYESCDLFTADAEAAARYVANTFGNTLDDARLWFSQLRYSKKGELSEAMLAECVRTLVDAGVLDAAVDTKTLYDADIAKVMDNLTG